MRNLFILAAGLLLVSTLVAADTPIKYPETRRVEQVDDFHGIRVTDPYRWLADDVRKSKDVADWVAAQNKGTDAFLEATPEREAIGKRLTALWNYGKFGVPVRVGGRYFFSKNDGLQNQSVLYTMAELGR